MAGLVPDSRDMLMIVANVGAIMSMLAFTSEVGSGSSTLVFVGHFVTNEITPYVVMPENTLSKILHTAHSQC